MQLNLADVETEALRDTVKSRLDTLLMSLGNTDSLGYKDKLRSEMAILEGIYEQLGCVHQRGTEAPSCTTPEAERPPDDWRDDEV